MGSKIIEAFQSLCIFSQGDVGGSLIMASGSGRGGRGGDIDIRGSASSSPLARSGTVQLRSADSVGSTGS